MKGIILAAGKGTRLYPITLPVCKPLLPVYDKPLIYYSLGTLMHAGIRDILIIVPKGEIDTFVDLLGDGSRFGIHITYLEQEVQLGIADAFRIGAEFIGDDSVCLALGDNIFFGPAYRQKLRKTVKNFKDGAAIFGYYVPDPRQFGLVEFDHDGHAISIEEKPDHPKSNYIVPGLYFYDNEVVKIAQEIEPSDRGELEITSVNSTYLEKGNLKVITLEEEYSWFDVGNADSLYEAAGEIKMVQRSGKMIACLEEIALQNRWVTVDDVKEAAEKMLQTKYGQYMMSVVEDLEE